MEACLFVQQSPLYVDSWNVCCPALLQRTRHGRLESRTGSSRGDATLWSVHCPPLLQKRRVDVRAGAGEQRKSSRGGENLWRSELSTSSWSDESFLKRAEEEQEEEEKGQMSRKGINNEKGGVMAVVGSLVEKLLVADFFFILFILAWFLAGLAEKAAFDTSSLIDVWLPLWPILFQPALGFFMAGSLWTAISKNWQKR